MTRHRHPSELEARYAEPMPALGRFDPVTLDPLPGPAQRFLHRAIPAGTPLGRTVVVEMEGEIKVRGWTPFRAREVLRAGEGFIWRVVAGRWPMRISGGDRLSSDGAAMDFRLWGAIPLVRSSGPDVSRSAAGRLAAETVCWLPQCVAPQVGARWTPVDDRRATVVVAAAGEDVEVTVTVDGDGRLEEVSLLRWGDVGGDGFAYRPFGGTHHGEVMSDAAVVVPGEGSVGWGWGTPAWDEGEFFRFRLTSVQHPST